MAITSNQIYINLEKVVDIRTIPGKGDRLLILEKISRATYTSHNCDRFNVDSQNEILFCNARSGGSDILTGGWRAADR